MRFCRISQGRPVRFHVAPAGSASARQIISARYGFELSKVYSRDVRRIMQG